MSTIEKIQTFIILFAVTCGIVLGQFNMIHTYSDKFIVPSYFSCYMDYSSAFH